MVKTIKDLVETYIIEVGGEYSKTKKIKVRPKSESKILKIITPLIEVFNSNFSNKFLVTIGNTIWVPDGWFDVTPEHHYFKSRIQIIAHECLHIKQASKQGKIVHSLLYMFPQILALFSLLSLLAIPFSASWLWCLFFLLMLAPLPAPFRYKKELEAYRMLLVFLKDVYKLDEDKDREIFEMNKKGIVEHLSGVNYYLCWPFPSSIKKELNKKEPLKAEKYKKAVEFAKRYNLTD